MAADELLTRLMAETDDYDPAVHTRSLLMPYRAVLLKQRAKFMSYEQISATLAKHGITVSAAAVGVFCRRYFTKAEIERARGRRNSPGADQPGEPPATSESSGIERVGVIQTTLPLGLKKLAPAHPARRGPKIARDDY